MEGPQVPTNQDRLQMDSADTELLDHLVEVGFDISALNSLDDETRHRAERLVAMLGLLDSYPVDPPSGEQRDSLIAATLARINREEHEQRDRMRLDSTARLPRLRLREFVAIAGEAAAKQLEADASGSIVGGQS